MNDGFRSISARAGDSSSNGDLGMVFVMGFMHATRHGNGFWKIQIQLDFFLLTSLDWITLDVDVHMLH
jgi:hypothetical protein